MHSARLPATVYGMETDNREAGPGGRTGLLLVHEGYLFRSPAGEPIMIGLSALSAFFVLALFRWKKWGSGGSFW